MSEHNNSLRVATIVPAQNQNPGHPQIANGTKVLLSDGSELAGVISVTLTATAGNLWQATITVMPERVHQVTAEANIVEVETTDLASLSRTYARAEA